MKICHINMFYLPTFGGVEQVMYELAKRQVEQGHEVHVYCCDSDKYKRIKKKEEIIGGVHVHRVRYWFRLSLNTFIWPGLFFRLLGDDFDIVHTHVSAHDYVFTTGLVSKMKGFKHVHTTHCPWTDKFRPLSVRIPLFFTNLLFNRWAFSLTDKIIAITPWEVETLRRWTKADKIKVIRNGMDKIFFKKIKNNKFKQRYKIKGKFVLFFGRLNITKGPEKFVEVAKEILKDRKDVSFALVGPDEGMRALVVKLIGKEPRIKLIGALRGKEKVAEMYQSADVYVLPSYREGLPLTLFEAMAVGLPIVASPCNGVPYEMKDGKNGFLVKYGDISGLKKSILKILDDKKLAKKMSLENIKKSKNYTWDLIAEEYMGEYRKLC